MKLWKKGNDFLLSPDSVPAPDGYTPAEALPIASEAIKYTYHFADGQRSSRYEMLRLLLNLTDNGRHRHPRERKKYKRDKERAKLHTQRARLLDRAHWTAKQLRCTPTTELKKRLEQIQAKIAKVEAQLWNH